MVAIGYHQTIAQRKSYIVRNQSPSSRYNSSRSPAPRAPSPRRSSARSPPSNAATHSNCRRRPAPRALSASIVWRNTTQRSLRSTSASRYSRNTTSLSTYDTFEHKTDPVLGRECGFESVHEAFRILPPDQARCVEYIEKHELVIVDLQFLTPPWLRGVAHRHHERHHDHRLCGHRPNRSLVERRRHPDLVEEIEFARPLVAKRRQLPHPHAYLVVCARNG